jgi:drug/metabolite transporter (DMT)-like permease
MSRNKVWMYICLMAAMIFWGLSFIWYKVAYQWFNPITVVFFRLLVSSSLLFLFSYFMRYLQLIKKGDMKLFLLAAVFEPFLYFLGESFGMKLVSSTLASLIITTIPLFTPVAAYFMYNERLSRLTTLGLLLSIVGVILVVLANNLDFSSSILGVSLLFLAVLSATAYSMIVKKLTESYNPFTIVSWQNFLGAVFFAPLFFSIDFPRIHFASLPLESIVPLLKLTLFASILSFVFFVNAIGKIGASRTNMFTNAIPVFTAFFAWMLLDEKLNWLKLTGMAVAIGGLIMSQAASFKFLKPWMIFKGQE